MNTGELRNTYPLWYLLSPEGRGNLATYQWQHFGVQLSIPSYPSRPIEVHTKLEELQEIDRIMRQKPHYSERRWHE